MDNEFKVKKINDKLINTNIDDKRNHQNSNFQNKEQVAFFKALKEKLENSEEINLDEKQKRR